MPVFLLALTNPSAYVAAVMKAVALGQQAGATDARSAGARTRRLHVDGSRDRVAALGRPVAVAGPVDADAVDHGGGAVCRRPACSARDAAAFRPSFWSNALVTTLILLGPAIEDSARRQGCARGVRDARCLFLVVAFYAWGTVRWLERCRAATSIAHSAGIPLRRSRHMT